MQRFEIFHKSKKFYLTNNKIVYGIGLPSLIAFLIGIVFKVNSDSLYMTISCYLFFFTFVFSVVVRGIGFFLRPPLRGTLDGFLAFDLNEIQIDQKRFPLSEIKKIEISNNDYYGKKVNLERTNSNSTISNGVDNKLEITLNSGAVENCYFQLYYPNDLQKSKTQLIHYYKSEKLDFNNLINILGVEKKEIEAFKSTIIEQPIESLAVGSDKVT